MGQEMPSLVKCCRCSRTFPVRAQMQFDGKALPMLVVLSQVDSVEAALEQATCQVCLERHGPADRGLYEVLKHLGLKGEEDEARPPREAAVVIRPTEDRSSGRVGAVIVSARPREVVIVDPLMGTSIQVTHQGPPAHDRRPNGPRRDKERTSYDRDPGAQRESERPIVHLTGAIGASGRNKRLLEAAAVGILAAEATRKRERIEKFMKVLFWLGLSLARIRKNAATSEVWDLVETFQRKLGEAIILDPHSRGKRGLLTELGTSGDELEVLCLLVHLGKDRIRLRRPIEVVMIDAYEGGRRPQSWDEKGGRRPAFYQLEVVRTKSSLPIPNPPLPSGDEDPRPRIVYPDGGQYGSDYEVENSQRGDRHQFDWELKPFGWAILSLASWLGDHTGLQVGGLNLCDLVCSFVEPILMEEEEVDGSHETYSTDTSTALSPELPAST